MIFTIAFDLYYGIRDTFGQLPVTLFQLQLRGEYTMTRARVPFLSFFFCLYSSYFATSRVENKTVTTNLEHRYKSITAGISFHDGSRRISFFPICSDSYPEKFSSVVLSCSSNTLTSSWCLNKRHFPVNTRNRVHKSAFLVYQNNISLNFSLRVR